MSTGNWQLARFSLDRQSIPIIIEDGTSDSSSLVYRADTRSVSFNKNIIIPGYVISNQSVHIADDVDTTSFGDPNLPPDVRAVYSQYVHQLEAQRPDLGYFFKLFSSMVLSALLASIGFAMKADSIDSRVGIAVGAIFGVLGSNYSIVGQLPPTSQITLADQVFFLSLMLVVLSLALAVVNWRLNAHDHTSTMAHRLDRLGAALPLIYLALLGWLVSL